MSDIIPIIGALAKPAQDQYIEVLSSLLPEVRFTPLAALTPQEKSKVRVAVVANPDPKDIAELPELVWIQSLWAGVEKLVDTFANSSIKVVRLEDPMLAYTMAEAALTWTLYLHRNMHVYSNQQNDQHWLQHPYVPPQKRTVAVLGLGNLGQAIAKKLLENDFNVIGWSRSEKNLESIESFAGHQKLKRVLTLSDIVICALPHTTETQGLLDHQMLSAVKPGCKLINFGRGSLINEQALLSALNNDVIEYAVLDVFLTEPLPNNHPFWTHPKIAVLPHISAPTLIETASKIAGNNLKAFLDNGEIPPPVDFSRGY